MRPPKAVVASGEDMPSSDSSCVPVSDMNKPEGSKRGKHRDKWSAGRKNHKAETGNFRDICVTC